MQTLRYYDTAFEAEVARGRLESEGIRAIVQNENLGSVLPYMGANQSLKPYLMVRDEDALQAAAILGIPVRPAAPSVCPACGSEDIAFRFFYKDKPAKRFMHYVLLPVMIAAGHTGNIRRGYNCHECGTWV